MEFNSFLSWFRKPSSLRVSFDSDSEPDLDLFIQHGKHNHTLQTVA